MCSILWNFPLAQLTPPMTIMLRLFDSKGLEKPLLYENESDAKDALKPSYCRATSRCVSRGLFYHIQTFCLTNQDRSMATTPDLLIETVLSPDQCISQTGTYCSLKV